MKRPEIKQEHHERGEFVYSKELCLNILKLREENVSFTNIYEKLNLVKYFPNCVSSATDRFYRDCRKYGIDYKHVYKRQYHAISKETYDNMYEDLKNNPGKYTIRELFEKHGVDNSTSKKALFYKDNPFGMEYSLKDLKDNIRYKYPGRSYEHCKHNGIKGAIKRSEKLYKKFMEMKACLDNGETLYAVSKAFGYKSVDVCNNSYSRMVKLYSKTV